MQDFDQLTSNYPWQPYEAIGTTEEQPMEIVETTPAVEDKEPFMYFEPHHQNGPSVVCQCGWIGSHHRKKVLLQKLNRHHQKTGHKFKNRDDE